MLPQVMAHQVAAALIPMLLLTALVHRAERVLLVKAMLAAWVHLNLAVLVMAVAVAVLAQRAAMRAAWRLILV